MDALLLGLTIGFAAGISPGPLLFLTVSTSLRAGTRQGVAVAMAPLVTDVVVVGLTLLVLDRLPSWTLAALGVAGGAFVGWTGVQTLREARTATLSPAADALLPRSTDALRHGAAVNLLSPHPWISWATAMGPLTVSTWRQGPGPAVALVAGFYLLLVGTKVAIAVLVGRSRHRLRDGGYRLALGTAGSLLVVAGAGLAVEFGPQLL